MEEIKFKAKTANTWDSKWVYGNYFHNFRKGESHNIVEFRTNIWHIVLPETVGQFTGCRDKKGEEIYKGDILTNNIDTRKRVVEWCDEEACFKLRHLGSEPYCEPFYLNDADFIVIGNEFD